GVPHRCSLFPYTTLFRSPRVRHGTDPESARETPLEAQAARVRDLGHAAAEVSQSSVPGVPCLQRPSNPGLRPLEWRRRLRQFPRSEEHTSELQSPCNLVC